MKAIVDFIRAHGNVKCVISIHSYSQMLLFPYGYRRAPAPDYQEMVRWPQNVGLGAPGKVRQSIPGASLLLLLDTAPILNPCTWVLLRDGPQTSKIRFFLGKPRAKEMGNDGL